MDKPAPSATTAELTAAARHRAGTRSCPTRPPRDLRFTRAVWSGVAVITLVWAGVLVALLRWAL